jgi:FkbH-like protein
MSLLPDAREAARRRRLGTELAGKASSSALRVSLLSTWNIDLLSPLLVEALARAGLAATVEAGPFGQLSQAILDPRSPLYASPPDAVVLVPATEDLLEPLFSSLPSAFTPAAADALVDDRLAELRELAAVVLERLPNATCYVVAFGTDRAPLEHVLDPNAPDRGQAAVERFVAGVRALSAESPRVVVIDWDWAVRSWGWDAVRDDRLWYVGRMRLSPVGCAALAELTARHMAAYRGLARKVVALDLDGLLWGGIVGEAGVGGITIGGEGAGLAHQELQRELLKLRDVGVLLVACSKNNASDAYEAFEHSEMILRREHLAAERINWLDKATNLRELADELDLGLDSFVFLDDNPIERSWVRQACPEVLVPELPADPTGWPTLLRAAPWFARVTTTDVDRRRAAAYVEQRRRRELRETTASFEDFLASLEQQVAIEPVGERSLARTVQLCQRTNQFNLTTRRYTAADVQQMLADGDYELYTLAVTDRFGQSGITGVAILRHQGERTVIDSLLLSCRVLGRKVEDAFLAFVAERAVIRGSTTLVGLYEPTAKNVQTASFYPDRGFVPERPGVFRYDLGAGVPDPPPEVEVRVRANA